VKNAVIGRDEVFYHERGGLRKCGTGLGMRDTPQRLKPQSE
jgi:hypothetical protein